MTAEKDAAGKPRPLYAESDFEREVGESVDAAEAYRSAARRDYARLIHSASFRRLQGKTQVFPGLESDFYRNRLTHSLEVAQIAKSIAIRLNDTDPLFADPDQKINIDIVEFAGLAHDLGHPPFGHNGEEALDECMHDYGGFEGNAQSLRIVSRLEKKATLDPLEGDVRAFDASGNDLRRGLAPTYRSLASILKYDFIIPERSGDRRTEGALKGYYADDEDLVRRIKANVIGEENFVGFKTLECSIMDIADDIAYSTYDLEDNLKAGFLTPAGLLSLDEEVYDAVISTINNRIKKQYPEQSSIDLAAVKTVIYTLLMDAVFPPSPSFIMDGQTDQSKGKMYLSAEVQAASKRLAGDGYHRTRFTSGLVKYFMAGIVTVAHPKYPQLHQVKLDYETFIVVEVLKNITFHAVIRAPGLQVVECRGKDIVKRIFSALSDKGGERLLPDDFRALCKHPNIMVRNRSICDFIAGMTDRYAVEFYSRLYGAGSLSVHKPL